MLQKKVQMSGKTQQQLREALKERDQSLEKAKEILHKELGYLDREASKKLRATSHTKQLQESVAALRAQVARESAALKAAQNRSQAGAERLEAAKAANSIALQSLREAQGRAAQAKKLLADTRMQGQDAHTTSHSRMDRLQNVIQSMRAEDASEAMLARRYQWNATEMEKQLQLVRQNTASAMASKQNADISTSQVIRKWKDTLAQLRNQVAINSELEAQLKSSSGTADRQLADLEDEVRARDSQITDLQEQADEQAMQAGMQNPMQAYLSAPRARAL